MERKNNSSNNSNNSNFQALVDEIAGLAIRRFAEGNRNPGAVEASDLFEAQRGAGVIPPVQVTLPDVELDENGVQRPPSQAKSSRKGDGIDECGAG